MIHFPPIKTRRLNLELKELTISQAVALASMPPKLEEAEYTKFLRFIIKESEGLSDPLDWTVQERMLVVAQYLSATHDEGPDFPIGDEAHYSDYLEGETDIFYADEQVPVGELEGDTWKIQHLLGRHAEAIESLLGEIKDPDGEPITPYFHFLLGTMAAQLVREGEEIPDPKDGAGKYEEFLLNRMKIFANYPESAFAALMFMWDQGRERLHHLFTIEIDRVNGGYVAAPKGGAADSRNLPLARFPVSTVITSCSRLISQNFVR